MSCKEHWAVKSLISTEHIFDDETLDNKISLEH